MLVQPKFNSKYGYNCSWKQTLLNSPSNVDVLTMICVLKTPVKFYVHIDIRSSFCKYFISVSENSLMANVFLRHIRRTCTMNVT